MMFMKAYLLRPKLEIPRSADASNRRVIELIQDGMIVLFPTVYGFTRWSTIACKRNKTSPQQTIRCSKVDALRFLVNCSSFVDEVDRESSGHRGHSY